MATLVLQDELLLDGMPDFVAADAGGDEAPNPRSRTAIWIINDGAEMTLTITSSRESNFGPYPNKVITIPSGVSYFTPQFDARRFDNLNGRISFIFSRVSDVTVAAVERGTVYQD
jgi:hypothetical protein